MPSHVDRAREHERACTQNSGVETTRKPLTHPLPDPVLSGMVAIGLCLEAICAYLGLSPSLLFDRLAALGLPAPPDKPMRRPCGKNPWTVAQTRLFIGWWLDGVPVRTIAEALGRSRGGIYGKRRRLGLPKRDRNGLSERSVDELRVMLAAEGIIIPDPSSPVAPSSGAAEAEPAQQPAARAVALGQERSAPSGTISAETEAGNPGGPLGPIAPAALGGAQAAAILLQASAIAFDGAQKKPKRSNHQATVYITRDMKREIDLRVLAGQHCKRIAEEMGLRRKQVESYACRSESTKIRKRFRIPIVQTYDPELARENIEKFRLYQKPWLMNDRDQEGFWTYRGSGQYLGRRANYVKSQKAMSDSTYAGYC